MVYVSQPVPGGHFVVVDSPDTGGVVASFADDKSVRTLTSWAADLAVVGLIADHEHLAPSGISPVQSAPDSGVEVASVFVADGVRAYYLHPESSLAAPIPPGELGRLVALGAGKAIAAGIDVTGPGEGEPADEPV